MATSDALLNLIFDPFALVRVGADENHSDGSAVQLIVDPCLNGSFTLPLDLFELSLVDESGFQHAADDVAITHIHRALHIVICEAEKHRSEERREGNEWVSRCRSRWS